MSDEDTTHQRVTEALLSPLRRTPPPLTPQRHDAIWRNVRSTMDADDAGRRRHVGWAWATAGLAAAGAAIWVASIETRPTPADGVTGTVARGTSASPPAPREADSVVSAQRLPSGAVAEAVLGGRFEVVEGTDSSTRLRVLAGGVRSSVPRLAPGQWYEVETPEAVVAVRGTRFTVSTTAPSTTVVEVEEGKVEVAPRDWRVPSAVLPGERRTLTQCAATIDAAWSSVDGRCFAEARAARAAVAADPVERDSLWLEGGLRVAALDAAEAAAWWRRMREASPAGVHDEEVRFRELEALGASGRLETRGALARAYLEAYSNSPRRVVVSAWVVPPR